MVDHVWFYDLLQHLTAVLHLLLPYYLLLYRAPAGACLVRAEERVNVDKWSCLAAN